MNDFNTANESSTALDTDKVELNNTTLQDALADNDIELPAEQVEAIDRYCQSLWSWNEKINLTRHTDYDRFVTRDLVDAMAIEPYLEPGMRILDVGSGGGVPGVVLAILRPDLTVELSESVGKRARVLQDIVTETGLGLTVHHGRAENVLEAEIFDTLVVRAVAPLAKLLTWFEPHWNAFARLLVLKGPAWVDERHAAREKGLFRGLKLRKLISYPLHGTESESVLLEIRPQE